MAVVSMNLLLEAGVHFGHQTKRWNPKMKEYIYGSRDDIYIIDLQKTQALIEEAYAEIKSIADNGGSFLFVGTKKQASEVAKEEAIRSEGVEEVFSTDKDINAEAVDLFSDEYITRISRIKLPNTRKRCN